MRGFLKSIVSTVHTRSITYRLEKLTDDLVMEDFTLSNPKNLIPKRSLYRKITDTLCYIASECLPTYYVGESGAKCRKVPNHDGCYKVTMIMPTTVPKIEVRSVSMRYWDFLLEINYKTIADAIWSGQQFPALRYDCRSGMVGDIVAIRSNYCQSVFMVCQNMGWKQVSPLTALVLLKLTDEQRLIFLGRILSVMDKWTLKEKLSLINSNEYGIERIL